MTSLGKDFLKSQPAPLSNNSYDLVVRLHKETEADLKQKVEQLNQSNTDESTKLSRREKNRIKESVYALSETLRFFQFLKMYECDGLMTLE